MLPDKDRCCLSINLAKFAGISFLEGIHFWPWQLHVLLLYHCSAWRSLYWTSSVLHWPCWFISEKVNVFFFSFFDFPLCLSFFNLQILMNVRRAQTSVMEASVPTPQGRTSVCALTVSCHLKIWRPAWVMDAHFMPKIKHRSYTLCSLALIRSISQRFTETA